MHPRKRKPETSWPSLGRLVALVRFCGFPVTLETAYWPRVYGNGATFHLPSQNIEKRLVDYVTGTPNRKFNHQRPAVFARRSSNATPIPKHHENVFRPFL